MVSQHPQPPEVMQMRIAPRLPARQPGPVAAPADHVVPAAAPVPVPPPWQIVIPSSQGGPPLLVIREEKGLLVVEGDEAKWSESARRFLYAMMQWAGQAGITWKDEARKAGEAG